MPLQIRRGTEAERLVLAVPPAEGELIWITDDKRLYIGDGVTLANALTPITGYTDDDAMDAAAGLFTSGTHTNISFAYDDANDKINATIDLSVYDGVIKASGFNGSLFADDSTELVNAIEGTIHLDGTVRGNIIPDADEAYDLGSSTYKFKDLYLSGSSIQLGGASITASGTAVNLPAGSTVGGALIGSGTGPGNSLNVDIIGDDSSIIVNSETAEIRGTFVGDLVGSVFADDSTVMIDAISNYISNGSINFEGDAVISPFTNAVFFGNETTPTKIIHIGTDDINEEVRGLTSGSDASGTLYNVARTSLSSPTTVVAGDTLANPLVVQAYTGSTYALSSVITTYADSAGTITPTAVPGAIGIYTFEDGNPSNAHGVYINRQGWVSINRPGTANAMLDVNGGAIFDGVVQAATFSGSYGLDNSTVIIDGATGSFNIANVDVVGSVAGTPAVGAGDLPNVNSWLEVSVNGATRYIPLYA